MYLETRIYYNNMSNIPLIKNHFVCQVIERKEKEKEIH